MTDVHAIAHRDCGGNVGVSREKWGDDKLVCNECGEVIEDIFENTRTDADDLEWLVARVLRGDDDVSLIDEDPDVWARKTSDDQTGLETFAVAGGSGD